MDIQTYLVLGIIIGIGVFFRQHYVFFRKLVSRGLVMENYKPFELLHSLYATIITTLTTQIVAEFLVFGLYDFSSPVTYILALLFGILGNDTYHQVIELLRMRGIIGKKIHRLQPD